MYQTLIFYHSFTRWLVLASLLFAIYRAIKGYYTHVPFSKTDNRVRHWTATIAQIQLTIGTVLYFNSPYVKYFWSNFDDAIRNIHMSFFPLFHAFLMLVAVVLVTIVSATAKRAETDRKKFKILLTGFSVALIIILLAIPWPFSPLSQRPYFR